MMASTVGSDATGNRVSVPWDEDLDAFLTSPVDLNLSSFRKSSTDTSSSNRSRLFASSTTSLDLMEDMDSGQIAASRFAQPINQGTTEESMGSFDWNRWESWERWNENNEAAEWFGVPPASTLMRTSKPSLDSKSDWRDMSISPNSSDVGFAQGSIDTSFNATVPFVLEDKPFEYGSKEATFAFDNSQFPADLLQPSTGGLLDSNSLEQFQFRAITDTYSNASLEQPRQDFSPQSYTFSGRSQSSADTSQISTYTSSPEPIKNPPTKKRKSSTVDQGVTVEPKRVPGKKLTHNMVEKRYRKSLNEKMAILRDSVPSLRSMREGNKQDDNDDEDDISEDGSRPSPKINKGVVLSEATRYIRDLEKRIKKLNDDMAIMKIRLNVFKTLARSKPMGANNGNVPNAEQMAWIPGNEGHQQYQASSQPFHQAQTPTHNIQHVDMQGRGGGGGYLSKLMVGSLAGLMVMQGFSESEQARDIPSARGLFAVPTQFMGGMRHTLQMMYPLSFGESESLFHGLRLLLKMVLFFGAIIYVISPAFFDVKPKEKAKSIPDFTLSSAPSLASPVEDRRHAWLTAIQTVWVPRQSFLIEIAALALKFLKIFLRNTIGWHGYARLTGATEDQEAARVKAWTIALDAQLAGGDADISISRLVLTMMASGTLPDTPSRLMLKALHIHVLLWEAGNSWLGGLHFFRRLAAKFARYQWEKARRLQKQINTPLGSDKTLGWDILPDYLARLLELDSDTVMVDDVVQRAYNLAWNKPTSFGVSTYVDGMDSIIDDPAIHSPLDALAAWCSCLVVHEILTDTLEARVSNADLKSTVNDGLDLAVKIAPTASLVQSQALVARSVLVQENRGANIAAALRTLPAFVKSGNSTPTNADSGASGFKSQPVPPDGVLAVRCAMAIALLKRPQCHSAAIALSEQLQISRRNLGLLGIAATYTFLETAFQDRVADEIGAVLENVAATLKVWMGEEQSKNTGLGKRAKVNITTLCVDVFTWLAGIRDVLQDDPGYATMSDE